jgi:hypothetical protein
LQDCALFNRRFTAEASGLTIRSSQGCFSAAVSLRYFSHSASAARRSCLTQAIGPTTTVSRFEVSGPGGHPVLFVPHDEHDHGWQFLDGAQPPSEFVHACMSHPIGQDRSHAFAVLYARA